MFRSYRTKLQLAFVLLGLAVIAATGWIASASATDALEQASYDRLTAARETRVQELARYFDNLRNQVQALSADDTVLLAMDQFEAAWPMIPAARDGSPDPRGAAVQRVWITENPNPLGAKDVLVESPKLGRYGELHARYHPTFHRYKTAFGFYDMFLIAPEDGRVLYTVMKETDVGIPLASEKYKSTPLASIFRKVMEGGPEGGVVLQDYMSYEPSGLAPAAFMAVPVIRAGEIDGVLAIQVASDEVNEVLDGGGHWREQGLGETGQVFAVGPDNTLRSDPRKAIENPEGYLQALRAAGMPEEIVGRMRRQKTAVLAYPINLDVVKLIRDGKRGTEIGERRGVEVLRSHAPAGLAGLDWTIIAEIDKAEALAPVEALRQQVWMIGLGVGLLFFFAARWLAVSVTEPVLAVAAGARHVGEGVRGLKVVKKSNDEIGQLADDFDRMIGDLERTTVSRDEYKTLTGRLITAQEDERRRIARELHDDVTQRLAAASIEIGRLERAADAERVRGLAELKQRMAAIAEDVHQLSRHLHPAMLDDLGLPAAVESECRASFERGGPIASVRVDGHFHDVPKDMQLALYRMTQEALRNIQKHSGSEEAELRLMRGEETVELTIRDRGAGFDRSSPDWKPGLGLASMEERVRLLGGKFWIDSRIGHGTAIHVRLPLGPAETGTGA